MAGRVLWLGAGFSYNVTRGDIPLMSGFFDRLDSSRSPNLYAFLQGLGSLRESANVEDVLCVVEELEDCPLGKKLRPAVGADHDFKAVRFELQRYCTERLCCGSLEQPSWALDFLAYHAGAATVVTTNYDNVAERILSNQPDLVHLNHGKPTCPHCIMRAILEEDCGCYGIESAKPMWQHGLIKLHGSIAWHVCKNPACGAHECLIPEAGCRPFKSWRCRCCGSVCEPVIVLPTKQKRYGAFPKLERMWDAAFDALKSADELVVFGFSFADSDTFIGRAFEKAIAAGDGPLHIWIADVDPESVATRLASRLPESRVITTEQLLVPRDFSQPQWWAESGVGAQ